MAIEGTWAILMKTPMGDKTGSVAFKSDGEVLTGTMTNEAGEMAIEDGEIDDNRLFWRTRVTQPMAITLEFDVEIVGDGLDGTVKFGSMGEAPVTGKRA